MQHHLAHYRKYNTRMSSGRVQHDYGRARNRLCRKQAMQATAGLRQRRRTVLPLLLLLATVVGCAQTRPPEEQPSRVTADGDRDEAVAVSYDRLVGTWRARTVENAPYTWGEPQQVVVTIEPLEAREDITRVMPYLGGTHWAELELVYEDRPDYREAGWVNERGEVAFGPLGSAMLFQYVWIDRDRLRLTNPESGTTGIFVRARRAD